MDFQLLGRTPTVRKGHDEDHFKIAGLGRMDAGDGHEIFAKFICMLDHRFGDIIDDNPNAQRVFVYRVYMKDDIDIRFFCSMGWFGLPLQINIDREHAFAHKVRHAIAYLFERLKNGCVVGARARGSGRAKSGRKGLVYATQLGKVLGRQGGPQRL